MDIVAQKYAQLDKKATSLKKEVTDFFNNIANTGVLDYILISDWHQALEVVRNRLNDEGPRGDQYVCGRISGEKDKDSNLIFKLKVSLDKL